jgi:hypothetical protein
MIAGNRENLLSRMMKLIQAQEVAGEEEAAKEVVVEGIIIPDSLREKLMISINISLTMRNTRRKKI